jgi:hypothetical protein
MAREFFTPECIHLSNLFQPKFGNTKSSIYFKGGEREDEQGRVI